MAGTSPPALALGVRGAAPVPRAGWGMVCGGHVGLDESCICPFQNAQ